MSLFVKRFINFSKITLSFALLLNIASCRQHKKEILTSTPLQVENIYTNPSYSHESLNNVICLPIQNPYNSPGIELHRESLTHALVRNIGKFNYFNLQYDPNISEHISAQVVNLTTGSIDRNLLGKLGKVYTSQAALKISVTEHSPFPPMKMRVQGSMIDTETAEIIWSFDQIFDSDDVNVIDSMRLWWNEYRSGSDQEKRFEVSKVRPSFFYNFVFNKMGKTYESSRSRDVISYKKIEVKERKLKKKLSKKHTNIKKKLKFK